jgi:hypothetical protein
VKHFSFYEWADFAREVSTAEQSVLMQQHLNAGCLECSKTLDLWRHIVNFAIREKCCEPPAWAVRAVNAMFAVSKVMSQTRGLQIAKLLFDSTGQPATVGLRGAAAVARQLLYKSGSVFIDMRVQPKPGSDSVVVIGQLLDCDKPDHGISGIPVSLLSQGKTVSRGKTNDIGEFDFGVNALDKMQLAFGFSKDRTIIVPVPDADCSTIVA